MSIEVKLDELAAAMKEHAYAYLVTVDAEQHPHLVAVSPRLEGAELRIDGPGRRTRANATDRPAVALVFPPAEAGGYSLIVDGQAHGDGEALRVVPTSAVLHRASTPGGAPSASGCGSDCVHVEV